MYRLSIALLPWIANYCEVGNTANKERSISTEILSIGKESKRERDQEEKLSTSINV
jgi:hypothetical protein